MPLIAEEVKPVEKIEARKKVNFYLSNNLLPTVTLGVRCQYNHLGLDLGGTIFPNVRDTSLRLWSASASGLYYINPYSDSARQHYLTAGVMTPPPDYFGKSMHGHCGYGIEFRKKNNAYWFASVGAMKSLDGMFTSPHLLPYANFGYAF